MNKYNAYFKGSISTETLFKLPPGHLVRLEKTDRGLSVIWQFADRMFGQRIAEFDAETGEYITDCFK